ncbi:zinc finger and BTB domain-containing protein 17-like isoform X5 [Syngnathoides biaculeatus]|uniref:zinc finger and BTB domain-containing protein 17-like isoform X5 n=1 Tax=Syngnathoides biaculeatus TaxID=300417 RepID=UPI002ADDF4CB|nr:zinc finger and BTB domain-containing protein 17-like isoform X5 [Syngnathoides biaculeatus]
MCARMTGKYKEEVRGLKKEEEAQCQLLDAVFSLQPRIVLRRAEISENLHPEWQQSVSCHIREEEEGEEVHRIKEEEEEVIHMKEEEQEEIIQVPSTGVHLKSEDGQSEESQGADPPRNCSSDRECHRRGLQTDGHDDDDEQLESDMACHTANKCWKCSQCRKAFASKGNLKQHVKRHTGGMPFTCSICGKRFTQKGHLKRHTRTHTVLHLAPTERTGQNRTQQGRRGVTNHAIEHAIACLPPSAPSLRRKPLLSSGNRLTAEPHPSLVINPLSSHANVAMVTNLMPSHVQASVASDPL